MLRKQIAKNLIRKKGHLVVVRVVVEVLSVDRGLNGEVPSAQLVPHSNTIGKLCNEERSKWQRVFPSWSPLR